MADVRAFRGWRYDLARVGTLSDVIAPPYDVISPELQAGLYARHPQNVIRLILGRAEPSDTETHNRYSRAAGDLRRWVQDGVLMEEPHPAVYVYHQTFDYAGRTHTRRGFLARVGLERFGAGRIFPHEQTMPGPKADRLNLTRATGMNLSPVFGLYPDPSNGIQDLLARAVAQSTPIEATDHLGVVNRLWPVTDVRIISEVHGRMGPMPVVIADGHHRYETAVRYRDDLAAAGQLRGPEDPANFVLMMLVGMSDPGLLILPTHRLISGLPGLTADALARTLAAHFQVERLGRGPAQGHEAWQWVEAPSSGPWPAAGAAPPPAQEALAFGTPADDEWLVAILTDREIMAQLVPGHSPAWRGLAVSILHELVLTHRLELSLPAGTPACRYVHRLDDVLDSVAARTCDLACLVPPATMAHVEAIASHQETMPPKSTYFYPKLLSGLVFNSLKAS